MKFDIMTRVKSLGPLGKYFFFGAAIFAIGLLTNFPYEKIQHLLTRSIQKQSGFQVQVAELSPSFPFGIVAREATIQGPPGRGTPVDLTFEKIRVSPSFFSLVTGPLKQSFSADILAVYEGSEWNADIAYSPSNMDVEFDTKDFKVRKDISLTDIAPSFAGAAPLTITSFVDLDVRLNGQTVQVSAGDLTNATGRLDVTAKKITIDNIPMMDLIRFDQIKIKGELAEGKLDIQSINLTGPDISGTANGSLKMTPYLMRSQLSLDCKLRLSDSLGGIASMAGAASGIRVENNETALRIVGPLNRLSVRGF